MTDDIRFVVTFLKPYDPITEELNESLSAAGIQFDRIKCPVMHYSGKGNQSEHHNDRFSIPTADWKSLRGWISEKISIMFGSNLEIKIEGNGQSIFVKGRTVEEIERMIALIKKHHPEPSTSVDEKSNVHLLNKHDEDGDESLPK